MGKKKNAPVGLGRRSISLGAMDPRGRRSADVQQAPELTLNKTLRVDSRGRQGVTPAAGVADLGTDATLEDVISKVNELLRGQRNAGHMEGGQ